MSKFRFIETNKGWKIFGCIVIGILVAIGIFCIITAVLASKHNVGFIQEIQSWKPVAKQVVDQVEQEVQAMIRF